MKPPLTPDEYVETVKRLVEHDAALRELAPKQEEAPIFADSQEEGEISEEELSKVLVGEKKLKSMTMSEIDATPINKLERLVKEAEDDEVAADNANDLYKIAARVKNLARGANMNLTPQGEMLANTFTHVLKSLYDFAETITDVNIKTKLIRLIRSHEGMPGDLIQAAGVGVTTKKKNEKDRT